MDVKKRNKNKNDRLTQSTCLFNERFSHPICKAFSILSWKDVEAVSRIEKQSSKHQALHVSDIC